ncbi:MAG: PDZ domain-containing protein [Oscillospiraceae bacterium]|nr:PDZ domain-containing protein [Oscillospiraceae bacterium]
MNPNQEPNFAQDTYQTGSTQPPKSHGGLIAFLLVLVIFLCGVSTALGLMNIRLLDSLNQSEKETAPVAFSGTGPEENADATSFRLGFSGQEIPEFWCVYQELPHGIYITDVEESSDAACKGVLPGDILLQVNGEAITSTAQLTSLLKEKSTPVQAVFYRSGEKLELTLSIDH